MAEPKWRYLVPGYIMNKVGWWECTCQCDSPPQPRLNHPWNRTSWGYYFLTICYRSQTKFGARQYFYTCLSFCSQGGMHGCSRGAFVVAPGGVCGCSGGHVWLLLGGMHGCSRGWHAWLLPGGVHGCSLEWHVWLLPWGHAWLLLGGMHGCSGGHAWLLQGGMHGCSGGRVWLLLGGWHAWLLPGGVCVCSRGHAWLLPGRHVWLLREGCALDTTRYGDTINEWAVRILLECILVNYVTRPI